MHAVRLRAQLRPLARDAKPTVNDLSNIIRKPGTDNDLTELTETFPPLATAALDTKDRKVDEGAGPVDVGTVPGAFPTSTKALKDSAPIIAQGRPYTPDLFGWFDDFSTPGQYDALGGFTRVQVVFNASNLANIVPNLLPLDDRAIETAPNLSSEQYRRCPGGAEPPAGDNSNVLSQSQQDALGCRNADRATGAGGPR